MSRSATTSTQIDFGPIDNYLFFGGGQVLFDLACDLTDAGETVRVVTTRRHALDTVRGRHGSGEFLAALRARDIEAWATPDVRSDAATLQAITRGTLGISLGAEWIFPASFIALFEGRLVNLHGSRLPLTRGGGGFSWLILMGERRNGSRIHLLDAGVDTGAIVAARDYTFPADCRIPADYQALARSENAVLLREFVAGVQARKSFELEPQDESASTYWPRLDTATQGFIDWSWNAAELERFICAFDDPYQGASTFWNGARIFLKSCSMSGDDGTFHPFQSGLVYRKAGDAVFIAATTAAVVVRSVRGEDGAPCHEKLRLGDRLHTPRDVLDEAMRRRAVLRPLPL